MTSPSEKRGQLVQLFPAREADLSDRGLVAACAAGDRAARAQLFERHVAVVHRTVRRMRGSDEHAVDDLVQGTFLAAFGAAATFRGDAVKPWLLGIAVNVVRDYARREIRRKRALEAVAHTTVAPARRDAFLVARLPDAIAELPHDLRAALVLIDLEGERGIDAARALGIPEGTLWRRVFHARQTLRARLGGDA